MILGAAALCALNARAEDFSESPIKQANGVVRFAQPMMSHAEDEASAFNPTAIVMGDRIAMLYRAEVINKGKLNQIRLAFSDDGVHFTRSHAGTVLGADETYDAAGAEDPRVVKFGSTYYMTYVGDPRGLNQTQCLATSEDLIHWQKKGVVLQPPAWGPQEVKAAVIVPEKMNGKYIMYFIGQKIPWHPSMGMATSDDLLHWTPLDHPAMQNGLGLVFAGGSFQDFKALRGAFHRAQVQI